MIRHLLVNDGTALSVYFPLGPLAENRGRARPPAARLRALVTRAEQSLRRGGVVGESASNMVGALLEVADGLDRDHHHEEGFGFFASAARSRMVSLPTPVPELLEVGATFYVKPLLGVVGRAQRFHVLALDPTDARLYAATPYTWEELPLDIMPDLPDDPPPSRSASGHQAARLTDDVKGDLARIAAAARVALGDDSPPVLIAAEPALAAYVRQLDVIPSLHPEHLAVDPFALAPEELRARGVAAMRSVVDAEPEAVIARATRGRPGKSVGVALDEILARSRDGGVEVVVVAEDRVVRGDAGAPATVETAPRAGAGPDLLNEAAVETLRRGGRAFTLPIDRMPPGVPAVAIYRG